MPLPEPRLDDLRFQRDLVDEARRRIVQYCPEWTDYNLSDPGITLVELFAWMTELITYRLNRVPEKNYIHFMNLLGVQLRPARSARVELTFRLSTVFPISAGDTTTANVPAGTEVSTRRTEEEPEIIFTTDERLTVAPPQLVELRRAEDFQKNYLSRLGVETFYAFNARRPVPGNLFYIGFDSAHNLSGHIVQLHFLCEETEATGVKRSDPPLVWEISNGKGEWLELTPSILPNERDTTGGLNNPQGLITFYLPLDLQPDVVNGRTAFWIRCQLLQRRKEQGMYSQSPRIIGLTAYTSGATTRATHAVVVHEEVLGTSDGEPGQIFRTLNAPVLALQLNERLEVEESRDGEVVFIPWERVNDFSASTRYDRHYMLDNATGEVLFGPCIRQADGNMLQYGRVPEAGRPVRFNRYRYGGGVIGNVPPGHIQVLRSTLPYVDNVVNLSYAEGGRDQETLDEAKMRARREVRAQQRAVTAEDYENLARGATRGVARAKCLTPTTNEGQLPPGMVEVLIVPAAFDSVRANDLTKLALEPALVTTVQTTLDKARLLTTSVRLREPNYLGIKVEADIVVSEYSQPEAVRQRALEAIRNFISPLGIGDETVLTELTGATWEGWPFGRALYQSELYTLLQRVSGVKHVMDVRLSQRRMAIRQEAPKPATATATEDTGFAAITQRRFEVPNDTLLCSLEHEINLLDL